MTEGRSPAYNRKVAVITGGSSGIGAAVAREAARRGFDLVLTARRADRLDALAGEIGAGVHTVAADLADPDAPEAIVRAARDRFGRLDVLVNNAGLGLPHLFAESDPDALRRQVAVNLTAPLLLTRAALPELVAARGVVVNVGSAITCVPNPALGAYGATKAGLAYWNDALRRELRGRGVRVCLVEPGPVGTEFFEATTRLGRGPDDVHPLHAGTTPWMSADVRDVARRVVALFERPRRRVSVLRRVVGPIRVAGALFAAWPALGDAIVAAVLRRYETRGPARERERPERSPGHAAPRV